MFAFLESFIDYFYTLDQEEKVDKLLTDFNHDIPSINDEDISSLDIYYFEIFHINPIRMNITYMANPSHDDIVLQNASIQKALGYIGKLTNIERAPLELNCLILEHPYCSKDDLVGRIISHYTGAVIKQAYLILGSADFLGNPVSLFTNLGTGVKDFFYEPAKGIVKSPKDFGVGLAKGTKSLLKKTVYGLFDTASKLTGTVAKVGTNLTFDSEYQKERSIRNQAKARHAGEGIAYGVRDLGIGLFKGITGVVVQPIKGVKKEGALGFFKGVGKGVAGIVLKPTIGAVDLITRTTEGIKNTTTYFDEKLKIPIRPPRYIPDDIVIMYNFEKSLGLQVLKSLESKKLKEQTYVGHVLLKKGKFLMITKEMILFIEQAIIRLGFQWVVDWKTNINAVIDIQLDEKGKVIYVIEKKEEKNIVHKVPCANIEESRLCYQLLLQSGAKLQPLLDDERKKDVELKLGEDVFEVLDEDDEIDELDLTAKRHQRQRQRKQKYANERTKLLGDGEKHESCSEYCSNCCSQCTIQ